MTAPVAVGRQEVQVIAGDVECLGVVRSPEPDEGPRHVAELELGLNRGRLDQRHSFFGPAHRPRVNVIKLYIHPQRIENIVGTPKPVEPRSKLIQVGALVQCD